jgi:PfaD family protein
MIRFQGNGRSTGRGVWRGPASSIAYDAVEILRHLRRLDEPCYVLSTERGIGVTCDGGYAAWPSDGETSDGIEVVAASPPTSRRSLGEPAFLDTYDLDCAYMAGSMANAIASEEMVIALGQAGMLGSFGAGGLPPRRLEEAILRVQRALPTGPYAFNLIHSPNEPALEHNAVDLYLKHGVSVVEASAYLTLTPAVVRYRAAGLRLNRDGEIEIRNRVIAKLSRREVASKFMRPAPRKLLNGLVEQGAVTAQQAAMAEQVPMADDITVEADSGGHTDNRPLVCLMPSIVALRNEIQEEMGYTTPMRVGAAGGIGTPVSALGAFMMGAAYVVTGSINHACAEAGTSDYVKKLLAEADMADVMMAPAADMFEMGVNLQVLKRGTMFPLRARKLYEFYQTYDSLDAIPADERRKLESRVFQRSFDDVWDDCVAFFSERDPRQIERARQHPKRKMALVFRWYLGLATRWGIQGVKGRELDYQIWCGPAMGAFNDWVRDSYLGEPEARRVAEVARQIMDGAAFLYRVQALRMQGVDLPPSCGAWVPEKARTGVVDAAVL